MKTKIALTISIILNLLALTTLALYFYTPLFDSIVLYTSIPRICVLEAQTPDLMSDFCGVWLDVSEYPLDENGYPIELNL